jgi:transposase
MNRQRRHFSVEQKVAVLQEHFLDKVPVSDLCEKHGIGVTLFYSWQKLFLENGAAAFTANDKRRKADATAKDRQIAALQDKLQRKNEVLAELMEEHVQLKKENLGSPERPLLPGLSSSKSRRADRLKDA